MEKSEVLVNSAMVAVRAEDETEMQRTFIELSQLPVDEMVATVCLAVEDQVRGRDVEKLLAAAKIPLPDDPKRLIIGVWKSDFEDLAAYADDNLAELLGALIVLAASLQETGERIG